MKINKEKHSQQLTIGELEKFINAVKTQHPKDYKDIPVYIGDDDELFIVLGIEIIYQPHPKTMKTFLGVT